MTKWPIIRVGQGWDVHRLVSERPLRIGGVTIPFEKGAYGHSDADALLHAIIDALLGAAGLGDIGTHFSDTDARYHNVDSRDLLRQVSQKISTAGWSIQNIDASVLLQTPKLAPYISLMRNYIATDTNIAVECVNIKAKTYEKLGWVGQNEAIEAQAVCLLIKYDSVGP
jgi:2-C-methyl-D-erythritol 2,4-cyclodiphosphate synthase